MLRSGMATYPSTPSGRSDQTTQIYEGTNQIQRVVIAKRLLG
jgi:alkylation response protein AidB-like acyl-CoA dehydrogenase